MRRILSFEDMPKSVQNTIKEGIKNGDYTHFAIYDKTNDYRIGEYDDPETALLVANKITPYGCKILIIEAYNDNSIGSLPFCLFDIPNDFYRADTRIGLYETYDKAREIWKESTIGDFESILERCIREYNGDDMNADEFITHLYHDYSFDHESCIALIENIFRFAKLHYDDNESALSIAKWLMEGIGIDDDDMNRLTQIK